MAAYRYFPVAAICAILLAILLGGCAQTSRLDSGGFSTSGSAIWNWNQPPQGGTDEKSNRAPTEPSE